MACSALSSVPSSHWRVWSCTRRMSPLRNRADKVGVLDRDEDVAAAVGDAPRVAFLKRRRDDHHAGLARGDRLAFVLGGGEEVLGLVLGDVECFLAWWRILEGIDALLEKRCDHLLDGFAHAHLREELLHAPVDLDRLLAFEDDTHTLGVFDRDRGGLAAAGAFDELKEAQDPGDPPQLILLSRKLDDQDFLTACQKMPSYTDPSSAT
jgi:hypothetical protein